VFGGNVIFIFYNFLIDNGLINRWMNNLKNSVGIKTSRLSAQSKRINKVSGFNIRFCLEKN